MTACVQARLERLWNILKMPMVARIDMVIKYTSDPFADRLEQALDAWDSAAAAILHREDLLGRLVAVQKVRGINYPVVNKYPIGIVSEVWCAICLSNESTNSKGIEEI